MGHAATSVDKDVRGCVACAKRVRAVRWEGNGHQICRESPCAAQRRGGGALR